MPARLAYAAATLLTLWACAGGEMASFWARVPTLGLALLVVGAVAIRAQGRLPTFFRELRLSPVSAVGALGSALICLVPWALLALAVKVGAQLPLQLNYGAQTFAHSPQLGAVALALVLMPAWQFLSRGILLPLWGSGNVAFLDALTVGFGLQNFTAFLTTWFAGAVWNFTAQRWGLRTAALSAMLCGAGLFALSRAL